MAIEAVVETLENVPEALQSEYVEMEDGGFKLDVSEVNGYTLENTSGLRSALGKERSSVKSLTANVKKLEKQYEGIDLEELTSFKEKYESTNNTLASITEKYEALAALDPEAEADKLAKAKADRAIKTKQKEWQSQFETKTSEYEEALSSATDKSSILEKQLHNVLVRTAAVESLTKEGVGDNLDLMLPQMLNQIKYEVSEEGFSTYVADSEGNPRVKVDGTNMTTADLVEELKGKWPSQFQIKAKPGGGKAPNSAGIPPQNKPKDAISKISAGLKALQN